MTNESREYAMELLAIMVVDERAIKENRTQEEIFREFRRSRTFENLFDSETGLWMNGPDYISEEYDLELERKKLGCNGIVCL